MAEAIVRVCADAELAETMGQAAHERAVSLYGAQRTAQATFAFYRLLLERSG